MSTERVRALVELRRGPEAVTAASRLLAADPHDVEALLLLSAAHLVAGDPTEARRAAEHAVAVAPDAPEPSRALAEALRAGGEPDLAVAAAREAVRLGPLSVGAASTLAVCLADAGREEDAVAAARRLAVLAPADPAAQLAVGYALHCSRPELARAAYQRCLRLDPADALARQNLAALDGRRRPLAAIDGFAASLALDPTLRVARTNLAQQLNRVLLLLVLGTLLAARLAGASFGSDSFVLVVLGVGALALVAFLGRLPRSVRRSLRPLLLPGVAGYRRPLLAVAAGLAVAIAGCGWLVRAGSGAQLPGMVVGLGLLVSIFGLVGVVVGVRDARLRDAT